MGSGTYSYSSASDRSYSRKLYASTVSDAVFRSETFGRRSLDPDMDIKNKIRESRDTEEHPNAFPIIIALDTTGSMGSIPKELVTGAFPEIMKNILDAGIPDPQVCFIGVGDCYYDDAPIQCGQFESSDELMEKWLQKVYLEGGGGGNTGESYNLAWYFATYHTSTDYLEKHGKKGVLITIGDECNLKSIPKEDIIKLFGDGAQADKLTTNLLEETREKWNVFHIQMGDSKNYTHEIKYWKDLIGEDNLFVLNRDKNNKIISTISSIILNVYNANKDSVFSVSVDINNTNTDTPNALDQKISL